MNIILCLIDINRWLSHIIDSVHLLSFLNQIQLSLVPYCSDAKN